MKLASAVAAIAATAAAIGTVTALSQQTDMAARETAIKGSWRRLPAPVSIQTAARVEGASLFAAANNLYLATVESSDRRRTVQRIVLRRWTGQRWVRPAPTQALRTDDGVTIQTAQIGRRPCVGYVYRSRPRVACLDNEKQHWDITVFAARKGALADALLENGGTPLLAQSYYDKTWTPPGGGTRGTRAAQLIDLGDPDRSTAPVLSPPDYGVLRPSWIDGTQPCVAFGTYQSGVPSIHLQCSTGGTWRDEIQPLDSKTLSEPRMSLGGFDADGATSYDNRYFIGIDRFERPRQAGGRRDVDWPVYTAKAGQPPALSDLGSTDPRWSEQGNLLTHGRSVWSIRFDQQVDRKGFLARIIVRRWDSSTGHSRDIGPPLLQPSRIYGPVYYGLTQHQGATYALWTVPNREAKTNALAVGVWRPRNTGQ